MDQLITVVNKLQDAFSVLGSSPLSLPQIAVVGGQSAGKSSVLENIVGRDFLPRGSGIVTRRPLVLKLVNEPGLKDDWGEFLHAKGKKFMDYEAIRAEIENATENDPRCANKGISRVPINLTIHSATVLNLTLVDLPGMTRVAVGDQPKDINDQIRAMLMEYITQENTIILAVSPANQDLANSDAIQLATEVDPSGKRTVGVLTKLDLMDRGTDAMNVLNNEVVPLRLGYIPVVNRAQADIDGKMDIKAAWESEKKFFRSHPKYGQIFERCGTQFLAQTLNKTLVNHIKGCLPDIVAKIQDFMHKRQEELDELEELGDASSKAQLVLQCLVGYASKFKEMIEGRDEDMSESEISGGAKIADLLHGPFRETIEDVDVMDAMTPSQLRNIIRNAGGLGGGLFIPDEAFQLVIRRAIKKLDSPAKTCVQMVYDELMTQAMEIETPEMARFAMLKDRVHQGAREVIQARMVETKDLVETLIKMETCLINVKHPQFVGGLSLSDMVRQAEGAASMMKSAASGRSPPARHVTRPSTITSMNSSIGSLDDISEGDEATLLIQGWLSKQTKHTMRGETWDRRYCKIEKRALIYAKDERGSDAKKIDLHNCSIRKTHEKTFEITGGRLTKGFVWRCDDAATTDKWVQAIQVASDPEAWEAFTAGQAAASSVQLGASGNVRQSMRGAPPIPSSIAEKRNRKASPSMSVGDVAQTKMIEGLLDSYFEIVRVKVLDSVPKAITLKMVNEAKDCMHTQLVKTLYDPEIIDDLLSETEESKERRARLKEVLELMGEAMLTIRQVQTGSGLKLGGGGGSAALADNPLRRK